MAYITKEFYDKSFRGETIIKSEFDRLAEIASTVVYDICRVKPSEETLGQEEFKKAVAYEVEFLYEQGGVDAILGFSNAALECNSERLGDYSVSAASGSQKVLTTRDGVPISPLAMMLLRRLGLMTRWAYAPFYK